MSDGEAMSRNAYGFNNGEGHRSVCDWGSGDLPAPYAEGDLIDVPEGAKALERMHGMGPGRYLVTYCASIDEGDAWFVRITPARRMRKGEQREWSDRLHLAWAPRSTWTEDHDWLAGCTLVETVDPAGLARRAKLIVAGWSMPPVHKCPTCLREMSEFLFGIMQERLAREDAVASGGTVES